ncbi:acetyl-CoA carboxylase biotin carboxyl carrier protein [Bacillus chungangensis]|uniref:Biotin carboxyl carrier protein of acetyl-CoA carboxylase n=1 Tax=Bacillus chungangensis TaxID=587633 RepID=A0ABT9WU44_9BACI|nr:acetyl-CoA carboxylase biotin carboxyl carrier protein [Bacillus chungangensis]MDQ0176417.1 acetyl-CoA carboxylase biotin carboxyl carrier protein [Bacillus chungangensis]
MINFKEMKEMMEIFDRSSIFKLKVKDGSNCFMLEKEQSQSQQKREEQPRQESMEDDPFLSINEASIETKEIQNESGEYQVIAPMVGTFYSRSHPDSNPFVQVGTEVKTGEVLCVLEAMKLFNEIQAEVSGEIIEIYVKDGQLVEYGQPIFNIQRTLSNHNGN